MLVEGKKLGRAVPRPLITKNAIAYLTQQNYGQHTAFGQQPCAPGSSSAKLLKYPALRKDVELARETSVGFQVYGHEIVLFH